MEMLNGERFETNINNYYQVVDVKRTCWKLK